MELLKQRSDGSNYEQQAPKAWFRQRHWQWVLSVTLAFGLSQVAPAPLQYAAQLQDLGWWFWPLFLLFQWGSALLMVPSLPLVALAAVVFSSQPWLVLMMTLIGVAGSAALIYGFSDALGLRRRCESDPRAQRARSWIQQRGAPALALWCAAPFLPTDLGCYLAASARMAFKNYLCAILVGESVLCAAVIFGTQRWVG